ncbi:uncharacterized protein LOC122521210 [Polistes fuscatus]|uniref:uncharacterized protein LOC122521210 n=1 Tax=Polistes fuscatus TaxID=30207 RepID=UPI001CA8B6DF|nr:uncharacterized protein LOC122521210 [Polistes fuscatus]
MKVGLLKNCLCYFTLRQGTILIAIMELFMSGFIIDFFVLALAHAMGIQEMVARDTEDALEREALEDISSNYLNTKKMDMAHHNATETIYSIYCGLVITVIHFMTSVLLLYGVVKNKRYFMTPWMMVMMTTISAFTISLFLVEQDCPFIAILGGKADICERVIVLLFVITSSYLWFVVYSTYKSLEIKKGLTHEVHSVNKKDPLPIAEGSKSFHVAANKPYEV